VLSEFQGKALSRSGKPKATLKPVGSSQTGIGGIAFDGQQSLWLPFCAGSPFTTGVVLALSPSDIHDLRARHFKFTPFAILHDSSVNCPQAVAFDHAENLWVINDLDGPSDPTKQLAEYLAIDVQKGGSPNPVKTIEIVDLSQPRNMTFDGSGNLWLVDSYTSHVVEVTGAQLAQTGPLAANLVVNPPSISAPLQLAADIIFDSNGDMWVDYGIGGPEELGELIKYAGSDLTGTGEIAPTPLVEISSLDPGDGNLPSIFNPRGMTFDQFGNLWLANRSYGPPAADGGSLVGFSPAQLSASGSPSPAIELLSTLPLPDKHKCKRSLNFASPSSIAFGPLIE